MTPDCYNTMISAILLGAGESKRMGKNKLLLPLGKKTIIERCLENLLRSDVEEVVVVINKKMKEIVDRFKEGNVKVVLNPYYRSGMSSSIRYGLRFINPKNDGILIALGDQPFLKSKTINALIRKFAQGKKGIVLPIYKGKKGHPVIFHKRYRNDLLKLRGDVGGKSIIEKYPEDIELYPVRSKSIIKDIDTWKDYLSLKEVKRF
jgi:molybdenum cofactor cytidylyltransferase